MFHYIALIRFPDGKVTECQIGATSRPRLADTERTLRANFEEPLLQVRWILTEEEFNNLPF